MKYFILLLTLITSPAFAIGPDAGRTSPKTAIEHVQANKALVIDVREDAEIKAGKVKEAKVFPTSRIGTPEWDKFVKTLPKAKEIYTYCASGGRADKVAEALRSKGFKASSTGGYKDWLNAGAKSN